MTDTGNITSPTPSETLQAWRGPLLLVLGVGTAVVYAVSMDSRVDAARAEADAVAALGAAIAARSPNKSESEKPGGLVAPGQQQP